MAKIEVFCMLGRNAKPYAEFMRYTGMRTASGKHEIEWKCVSTYGNDKGYNLAEPPEGFEIVDSVVNENAAGYHSIIKHMKTEKAAIIDVDVAILCHGWDDMMFSRIKHPVALVGSAHTTGSKNYQDFPNLCITMFDSLVLKSLNINLDSFPDTVTVNSKHDSRINKRPRGSKLERDTGWKIPYAYKEKKLSGCHMPEYLWDNGKLKSHMTESEKKILRSAGRADKIMSEQHLDGSLFSCHFRRSHQRDWDGELCTVYRNVINRYLDIII